MRRTVTIPALLLLTALAWALGPPRALAFHSAGKCQECHFSYYGSPQEVCQSCHQGALHYRHIYQEPGNDLFPPCGSPPSKCNCCHGTPPDYENPPLLAEDCASCHTITGTDVVSEHACSPYYHPDPGEGCLDCHGLNGLPGHRIVPECDGNDNCNDTLDNDADCSRDDQDPGCTVPPEPEICDDGKDNDFDGLIDGEDPDCCGDGIVTPPEACDDGNTIDCDGCSASCETEFCGDGKICPALGEACDDGNAADCDGCSASCETEFCGDGKICPALGEECDGEMGCASGYYCDETCTCRAESVAPCGATTTGRRPGASGAGINVGLLAVSLLFLLLLRALRPAWARAGRKG